MDSVFPPGEKNDPLSQWSKVIKAVDDETRLEVSVLKGSKHNPTIALSEVSGASIDHYLDEAEKINK